MSERRQPVRTVTSFQPEDSSIWPASWPRTGIAKSSAKEMSRRQTREVLDRLRTRLEAAGSSIGQVVCVTVYLKSASDFAAMNAAYRTYWPKDPPTRTTVIADLVLPDALDRDRP